MTFTYVIAMLWQLYNHLKCETENSAKSVTEVDTESIYTAT